MISLLCDSDILLMDDTFKIAPKNFYQILVIVVFDEKIAAYVPGAFSIMNNKEKSLYKAAFINLKYIMSNNKKDYQGPKTVVCDFEVGLRKALTHVFENITIRGCYFHFSKILWVRAARLGLKNNMFLRRTKILLVFSNILFIWNIQLDQKIWDDVVKIYKNKDRSYENFLKY